MCGSQSRFLETLVILKCSRVWLTSLLTKMWIYQSPGFPFRCLFRGIFSCVTVMYIQASSSHTLALCSFNSPEKPEYQVIARCYDVVMDR